MSREQAFEKLRELQVEMMKLRAKCKIGERRGGGIGEFNKIKRIKKDIARLYTHINQNDTKDRA